MKPLFGQTGSSSDSSYQINNGPSKAVKLVNSNTGVQMNLTVASPNCQVATTATSGALELVQAFGAYDFSNCSTA